MRLLVTNISIVIRIIKKNLKELFSKLITIWMMIKEFYTSKCIKINLVKRKPHKTWLNQLIKRTAYLLKIRVDNWKTSSQSLRYKNMKNLSKYYMYKMKNQNSKIFINTNKKKCKINWMPKSKLYKILMILKRRKKLNLHCKIKRLHLLVTKIKSLRTVARITKLIQKKKLIKFSF